MAILLGQISTHVPAIHVNITDLVFRKARRLLLLLYEGVRNSTNYPNSKIWGRSPIGQRGGQRRFRFGIPWRITRKHASKNPRKNPFLLAEYLHRTYSSTSDPYITMNTSSYVESHHILRLGLRMAQNPSRPPGSQVRRIFPTRQGSRV